MDRSYSRLHHLSTYLYDLLIPLRLGHQLDRWGSNFYSCGHSHHWMGCVCPSHFSAHDQSNGQGHILLLICVLCSLFQFYPYWDNLHFAAEVLYRGGVRGKSVHEFDAGVGSIKNENRVQGQQITMHDMLWNDDGGMYKIKMQPYFPRKLPLELGLHKARVSKLQEKNLNSLYINFH